MKLLTVVGARPQFIKAATVSRAVRELGIAESLLHTGQHYDANMSDVFFQELEIAKPDHHLAIGSGRHGEQTGRMLAGIEDVLLSERPDWVLVYGDTNSTLAAALAAVKLQVPVAHVEAGLRSFNRAMPEEINRVLTDHVSSMLFAPTETAVANLAREGVADGAIHRVGDVMYDAALYYAAKVRGRNHVLHTHHLEPKRYVLATLHRAENTDDPHRLLAIFSGLCAVAASIPVVLPLHPRTRRSLEGVGVDTSPITVIEPVGYLDMIVLERNARLIATDSGGVQKEAYFHRVPCVTIRDETEWVELIDAGWNELVLPDDADAVRRAILDGLNNRGRDVELYGNGAAAGAIARALLAAHEQGRLR